MFLGFLGGLFLCLCFLFVLFCFILFCFRLERLNIWLKKGIERNFPVWTLLSDLPGHARHLYQSKQSPGVMQGGHCLTLKNYLHLLQNLFLVVEENNR